MELINRYFDKLTFAYVEEKQGYAVYGAAISSMLASDKQRYVLAFVPAHLGINRRAKLQELPWINLQLRMCPRGSYPGLISQTWVFPHALENIPFRLVERDNKQSRYASEGVVHPFPFTLDLLHDPKKKSVYQYPGSTNLHWAMDQFATVLTYTGSVNPMELQVIPQYPPSINPPTGFSPIGGSVIRPPPLANPLGGWLEQDNEPNFELIPPQ